MSHKEEARNKGLQRMLEVIRMEANATAAFTGRKGISEPVLKAMETVDRAEFVPGHSQAFAYDNTPLSIGYGQTISQPYIVALMTDLLNVDADSIVLEIGTGSGYQAAVLSRLVKKVYTLEKIAELAEAARERLRKLGFRNVESRCADGYFGWAEYAPFDGVIVTAAASHVPESLVQQLKPGGRMVIPVGLPNMHQELMVITKDSAGEIHTESVLAVAFVPLVVSETELNRRDSSY